MADPGTAGVALITGGSRGIGKAVALRLARDGYSIAINYASQQSAAVAAMREIEAAGGSAAAFACDVANLAQVERMAAEIHARFGETPAVLVNNAGILRRGDFGEFNEADMDAMQRTNVNGVIHCATVFGSAMRERGYGRIINLTSVAAFGTSMAGTSFYAATKAAVITLTRRFALSLGPHGITVNAVAPGFILTDMVSQGRTPEEVEASLRMISSRAMTRRTGTPEDIAHAISFLASPESSFITAQVLKVDGGRTDYIA